VGQVGVSQNSDTELFEDGVLALGSAARHFAILPTARDACLA
jgi:hypothetical protein